MSWFQRQAMGRSERDVAREHGRYLRAAGVDRALDGLAGPYGLRRFLVAFDSRAVGSGRQMVEVTDIVAMPLRAGGGPPPDDPTGQRLPALEQALTRLNANMAVGPGWSRGVIGYVRDSKGRTQLFPLFDDDSDDARLDGLPVPPGAGHPLEQPAWDKLRANWEPRMGQVHARTARVRGDWDVWSVQDDQLTLCYDPLPPATTGAEVDQWRTVTRHRCQPLATYMPHRQRLTWQTDSRPGGPELFSEADLVADWGAAHEVALLAAAGLGADWLFAGEYGDQGERLYVAVFEAG